MPYKNLLAGACMAIGLCFHFLGNELARAASVSLISAKEVGLGSSSFTYTVAFGFPASAITLHAYTTSIRKYGTNATFRITSILSLLIYIGITYVSLAGLLHSSFIITQFIIVAFYAFREIHATLMSTQQWAFIISILDSSNSSYIVTFSGVISVASTVGGFLVEYIVKKFGVTGLLFASAISCVFTVLSAEIAYYLHGNKHHHSNTHKNISKDKLLHKSSSKEKIVHKDSMSIPKNFSKDKLLHKSSSKDRFIHKNSSKDNLSISRTNSPQYPSNSNIQNYCHTPSQSNSNMTNPQDNNTSTHKFSITSPVSGNNIPFSNPVSPSEDSGTVTVNPAATSVPTPTSTHTNLDSGDHHHTNGETLNSKNKKSSKVSHHHHHHHHSHSHNHSTNNTPHSNHHHHTTSTTTTPTTITTKIAKPNNSILQESFRLLSNSTLKLLVGEAIVHQCCANILHIIFYDVIRQKIIDDDDRAVVVGRFFASVNLFACVLQFLVIPRIMSHKTLPNLIFGTPIVIAAFGGLCTISPSLITVILSFGCLKVLEYAVLASAMEMIYMPFDDETRYLGKEYVRFFGSKLGKTGASLLFSAMTSYFKPSLTFQCFGGFIFALLWSVVMGGLSNHLKEKIELQEQSRLQLLQQQNIPTKVIANDEQTTQLKQMTTDASITTVIDDYKNTTLTTAATANIAHSSSNSIDKLLTSQESTAGINLNNILTLESQDSSLTTPSPKSMSINTTTAINPLSPNDSAYSNSKKNIPRLPLPSTLNSNSNSNNNNNNTVHNAVSDSFKSEGIAVITTSTSSLKTTDTILEKDLLLDAGTSMNEGIENMNNIIPFYVDVDIDTSSDPTISSFDNYESHNRSYNYDVNFNMSSASSSSPQNDHNNHYHSTGIALHNSTPNRKTPSLVTSTTLSSPEDTTSKERGNVEISTTTTTPTTTTMLPPPRMTSSIDDMMLHYRRPKAMSFGDAALSYFIAASDICKSSRALYDQDEAGALSPHSQNRSDYSGNDSWGDDDDDDDDENYSNSNSNCNSSRSDNESQINSARSLSSNQHEEMTHEDGSLYTTDESDSNHNDHHNKIKIKNININTDNNISPSLSPLNSENSNSPVQITDYTTKRKPITSTNNEISPNKNSILRSPKQYQNRSISVKKSHSKNKLSISVSNHSHLKKSNSVNFNHYLVSSPNRHSNHLQYPTHPLLTTPITSSSNNNNNNNNSTVGTPQPSINKRHMFFPPQCFEEYQNMLLASAHSSLNLPVLEQVEKQIDCEEENINNLTMTPRTSHSHKYNINTNSSCHSSQYISGKDSSLPSFDSFSTTSTSTNTLSNMSNNNSPPNPSWNISQGTTLFNMRSKAISQPFSLGLRQRPKNRSNST